MVKKNIKKTIEKHNLINEGEHIVIGLSGGPDSVCLFSVLEELSSEMNFTLHAVHVNHGFRPGAADEDQQYVEELCRGKGVECTSFIYDCNAIAKEEGLSSEEAGRKVRYELFLKVAQRLMQSDFICDEAGAGSDRVECGEEAPIPPEKIKIAVAHNADDQAETVLFRLLRGTGTDGLAGMAYSRKEQNIEVIRPLLDTWRREIETYCDEHGLEPRTDNTNLQPIYTRNKIRLDLIPYLQENFNPNIMETLGRMSSIASEDKDYLWKCAEEAYKVLEVAPGILRRQGLAELDAAVRHRVVMKALQEMGMTQGITAVHLDAVDGILDTKGESKMVEFPDGYRASVRYGEVVFYRDAAECGKNSLFSSSVCQSADFQQKYHMPAQKMQKVSHDDGQSDIFDTSRHPMSGQSNIFDTAVHNANAAALQIAQFDADKIRHHHGDAQPVLRTRQPGDYIAIKDGRKKLQNLFVDMKVPKEYRDSVQIAAIGSEILWIPLQPEKGVKKARHSNGYKLDSDTKNVLTLEFDCEI